MERQKILYVCTLTNNTHKQGGHATKDMSKRNPCLEITCLQRILLTQILLYNCNNHL